MSKTLMWLLGVLGILRISTVRSMQECPAGFFKAGISNQCFKYFSDVDRNFDDAKNKCEAENLRLAEPKDPISLRLYIIQNYGNRWIYLGARGDGISVKWLYGKNVDKLKDSPYWRPEEPGSKVNYDSCLFMMSNNKENRYINTPYFSSRCSDKRPILCEFSAIHPESYFGYDHHYSNRQCRVIHGGLIDGGNSGVTLAYCKASCDDHVECSAFNFKLNSGSSKGRCVLRDCGPDPPYPIGESKEGWKGYTRKHIKYGYSKYYGPYENYFTTKQGCVLPGVPKLTDKTYLECERHCDQTPMCTGFNFDIKNWACELRACTRGPLTPPEGHLEIWESWSKEYFKRNVRPKYKCPSLHCGKDQDRTLKPGTWVIIGDVGGDELEYKGEDTETDVEVEIVPLEPAPGVCSRCLNGKCGNTNVCICEQGWIGTYCQTSLCKPECVHSTCTGPNYCTCDPGWKGPDCHQTDPITDPKSPHTPDLGECMPACLNGYCDKFNVCVCHVGWKGTYCQTPLCNPRCVTGKCTGPNYCTCNPGWTGDICDAERTALYDGPRDFHWDEVQGCTLIKTWKDKSNIECEIECDKDTECGYLNISPAQCEMYSCPTSQEQPLAHDSVRRGWSKEKIPEYTSAYHKYDLYWTDQQCRLITTFKEYNKRQCDKICTDYESCTAYNYRNNHGCELRLCSDYPPHPIGNRRGGYWRGYTTDIIEDSGFFYGPYATYWTDDQCEEFGLHYSKTRVECEIICSRNPACSGFNFNRDTGDCVMRKCHTKPPSTPLGLKREWESFSKKRVSRPEVPDWKCPSFNCREGDIPVVDLEYPKRENLCNSCYCWKGPFCFFKCHKCRTHW